MQLKQIVLDFDGTFTDLAIEAAPFPAAFQAVLADLLGRRDVAAEWEASEQRVRARPSDYGWTFDGKVVAPSLADPYLLATAVMQEILDNAQVLSSQTTRTAVGQALYGLAYEKTVTGFKPNAKRCLAGLLALGIPVAVVTNSKTEIVARKLLELAPNGVERLQVIGEAKKFWVTAPTGPAPADLAEIERSAELARPIFLRRGKYLDVLRSLWLDSIRPEETLVVGDIYELDLALPAALGCAIALVTGPSTQPYERERVRAHGGTVLDDIGDAVAVAERLVHGSG